MASSATRPRWPYAGPPQRLLLIAALLAIVGSVLPWADTAFGTFNGLAGGGVWTLYAGVVGLAGALLRRRRLALVHAAVFGLIAAGVPLWQLSRLMQLGGFGQAWIPGGGLLLVAGAGAMALTAALRLHRAA